MKQEKSSKLIKIVATGAVLAAVVLQLLSLFVYMPGSLQAGLDVTKVVLIIHGIEGAIAAILILLYRLRSQEQRSTGDGSILTDHLPENTPLAVIKAALYVFFVGTIGLSEIIKAVKPAATETLTSD